MEPGRGGALKLDVSACAAAAALFAAAGCTSTYYDWGRYEDSVYVVSSRPDGFDLTAEIDALETQLEETRHRNRPVPPGAHAHLGWLLFRAGDAAGARGNFEAEKALYPESARLMDRLISEATAPK